MEKEMSERDGGRGSLDGMSGSFMNQEQQSKFHGHIQNSGMADAMQQGGQEKFSDLLSEEEISGVERSNSTTGASSEQEDSTASVDLDDDVFCPKCGKVIEKDIEFSDDELMSYLLGARISRQFKFGPISFRIQSLTQREVDDSNYRTGKDVDNGVALLELDIQNRLSVYFMVYQLVEIDGKRVSRELPKNPDVKEFEVWHEETLTKIKSFGHTLITALSRRCGKLEAALRDTLEDEVRLKK